MPLLTQMYCVVTCWRYTAYEVR